MKSLYKLLNLSDSPDKSQQRDKNITDPLVEQNTPETHELNIQKSLNIDVDLYLHLMKNKYNFFPAK